VTYFKHSFLKYSYDKCTGIILFTFIYIFFLMLLLYSKMHWLDTVCPLKHDNTFIYTFYRCIQLWFIVTNLTWNIYIYWSLYIYYYWHESHITLSSQWMGSQFIHVLNECALILQVSIRSTICRGTTIMPSEFYLLKKWLHKQICDT